MIKWKIRLWGVFAFILGGALFVYSVKSMTSEWPQIFVGLLSVFFSAMGFGLLIMPLELSQEQPMSRDDSRLE